MAIAFEESLIGITEALSTLRTSEQVSYILDSSLDLVCHNRAWDKFALQNSAPELANGSAIGKNLMSVIDESLRPFYSDAFHKVTQEKTVWEWEYECSSPELFRKFVMRIHPITPGGWFFVTNSLMVETERAPGEVDYSDYLDANGLIRVCAHCRCSKRVVPPERWDFVPANLNQKLVNVTHGLCPICHNYFYPRRRKQ
jgi:hypothetical protein